MPGFQRPTSNASKRKYSVGGPRIGGSGSSLSSFAGRAGRMFGSAAWAGAKGFGRELGKGVKGPKKERNTGQKYAFAKGWTSGVPVDKMVKRLQSAKIPKAEKKYLEAQLRTLGRTNKQRSQYVTKEKVRNVEKDLAGLIGEKQAASVMDHLQLDNKYGIFKEGKMLTGKKVADRVRSAKRLTKQERETAAYFLGGLDQKPKLPHEKGIFESQIEGLAKGAEAKFGTHTATKFEKIYQKREAPLGRRPAGAGWANNFRNALSFRQKREQTQSQTKTPSQENKENSGGSSLGQTPPAKNIN